MDPTTLSQVLIPKPYMNITELLATMGQLLIMGERTQDEKFKSRYIKLFDVMFKGLSLFMDKEFYQVGPDNVLKLHVDNSERQTLQFGDDLPDEGDGNPPEVS